MTARADYRETTCKTALNRVDGMGFRWSLNPYRGCVHGCHYCFARRYHAHFELNASEDFTGIIFVKIDVARVLREELWLPTWKRETVAIGTATDPYQPIEGKYRLTRQCLEEFADRRSPINLVTKGPMIVRDVDVLQSINRSADCTVCVTITTVDDDLWRSLEPTTAPPSKRLRAVETLTKAGIRAGVIVAPVIPGLTDGIAHMERVASAAAAHGAAFLTGGTLRLQGGTRDHFLRFLADAYPDLAPRYRTLYAYDYAPRHVQDEIGERMALLKRRHGLANREPAPDDEAKPRQLALALG